MSYRRGFHLWDPLLIYYKELKNKKKCGIIINIEKRGM